MFKLQKTYLLVGPLGAGKTTTGTALKKLGSHIQCINLDQYIAKKYKLGTAADYMGKVGKEVFYHESLVCIKEIQAANRKYKLLFIDVGSGSTSCYDCAELANKYVCISINGSPKYLYNREKCKKWFKSFEDYMFWNYAAHRRALYDNCSIGVDVTHMTPVEVAKNIILKIKNLN